MSWNHVGFFSLCLLAGLASAETRIKGLIDNNPTWTAAENPYILEGDVVVPEGMTLTIQPGVEIQVASSDLLSSGVDPIHVEVIVAGTLQVHGTPENRVLFSGDRWYGITIEKTSTATTLAGAEIDGAFRAITSHAHFDLRDSLLVNAWDSCLVQLEGKASVLGTAFRDCGHDAIFIDAEADLLLRRSLVTDSGKNRAAVRLFGKAHVDKSTLAKNLFGGVEIDSSQPVTIQNSIIAFNGPFGIHRVSSAAVLFSHNNTFGHTENFEGEAVNGSNNLSVDPLFVAVDDFRLVEASPCRQAGANGVDLGAFPFSGTVETLSTNISNINLRVKESLLLSAQAFDDDMQGVSTSFSWTVSPDVGTLQVSPDSRQATFTAKCAVGDFQQAITVSAGGKSLTLPVTVEKGPVEAIDITPAQVTLAAGQSLIFTARAVDVCGNLVTTEVDWSKEVGTIDDMGKYVAPTVPGTYNHAVIAKHSGISKTAKVLVTSGQVTTVSLNASSFELTPGAQLTLNVSASDAYGNPVSMPVSYTVAPEAGSVSNTGVLTAKTTAGTYPDALVAAVDGVMAKATVVVKPGPATQLQLEPKQVTLAPGGTTTFVAMAKDAFNNLTTDSVVWKVENAAAGTLTSDGKFTAGNQVGQYTGAVKAQVGNLSASANISVTPGGLFEIVVTPKQFRLAVGDSQALTAIGKDAQGNPVSITPTWKVLRGGGTVTPNGVFTAGDKVGTYENTVMVEVAGVTAVATVDVTAGPIVELKLAPTEIEMGTGTHQIFKLEAFDVHNNPVTAKNVAWNVDAAAGTITEKGVFTAGFEPGLYENAVSASVNGVSAYATVRIVAVKLPTTSKGDTKPSGSGCTHTGHAGLFPLAVLVWRLSGVRKRRQASGPSGTHPL